LAMLLEVRLWLVHNRYPFFDALDPKI
jgi:hypothetical protein